MSEGFLLENHCLSGLFDVKACFDCGIFEAEIPSDWAKLEAVRPASLFTGQNESWLGAEAV